MSIYDDGLYNLRTYLERQSVQKVAYAGCRRRFISRACINEQADPGEVTWSCFGRNSDFVLQCRYPNGFVLNILCYLVMF